MIKDETLAYLWIAAILVDIVGGAFIFGFADDSWHPKILGVAALVIVLALGMVPVFFIELFDRDPPP